MAAAGMQLSAGGGADVSIIAQQLAATAALQLRLEVRAHCAGGGGEGGQLLPLRHVRGRIRAVIRDTPPPCVLQAIGVMERRQQHEEALVQADALQRRTMDETV
jgi:hypothetical protein